MAVRMSCGPTDLFGLMAFSLRWTKSSYRGMSETEGTGVPNTIVLLLKTAIGSTKSCADTSKEFVHQLYLFFVVYGKASIFPF